MYERITSSHKEVAVAENGNSFKTAYIRSGRLELSQVTEGSLSFAEEMIGRPMLSS